MANRTVKIFRLLVWALAAAGPLVAQNPSVLTAEYDNARTTANNSEVALSPTTVTPSSFGKLGTWPVDGQVIGQPLYVPGLKIAKKKLNVLYVATMSNTVYAFNADAAGSAPLWQVNLGAAVPVRYAGVCPASYHTDQLGILSTPVIDAKGNAIYVVAANPVPGQAAYTHTLFALDLATGKQTHGGLIVIAGSVPGTGTTSANGAVPLGPTTQTLIQRPALLLSKGNVYIGFSGCGPDPSPYHGWVVGYSARNIRQQVFTYSATPNGDEGGIWQSGRGLVGDSAGSVYFETGNGTADQQTDFGNSIVKLSLKGQLQDWFTPADVQILSNLDLDLATTSPLLTPDTNLIVGGGKQGLVYVLNANSLGQFGNAVQIFAAGQPCAADVHNGCQKIHSLAYWQNAGPSELFIWTTGDNLRAYEYQNGQFVPSPIPQGTQTSAYPAGILTVTSAAGVPATGIVWALTPGVLHAFTATNLANELWNSNLNSTRDRLAGNNHFEQYTVAAGKVFIPDGSKGVVVYGLLP